MPKKGDLVYSTELGLNLAAVLPSVAGPKRPQDRIELPRLKNEFLAAFSKPVTENGFGIKAEEMSRTVHVSAGGEVHPGGGDQKNGNARSEGEMGSLPSSGS